MAVTSMEPEHTQDVPAALPEASERLLQEVVAATGGTQRKGQRDLAVAVAQMIRDGAVLCGQAGTGTGKSYAYTVPALLSKQQVVIATYSKSLQDQLFRDVETVGRHLAAATSKPAPTVQVLKGRDTYACLAKINGAFDDSPHNGKTATTPELDLGISAETDPTDTQHALEVMALKSWITDHAETGEQSEIPLIHSKAAWADVSVSSDDCLGKDCPFLNACFAEHARDAAARADVIITNQRLLALDMLRPGIIPTNDEDAASHRVVVVDEAHELPAVVADTFGAKITPRRVEALSRQIGNRITSRAKQKRVTDQLSQAAALLDHALQECGRDTNRDVLTTNAGAATRALEAIKNAAELGLNYLEATPPGDKPGRHAAALSAATRMVTDTELILTGSNDQQVVWSEFDGTKHSIRAALFDVAPIVAPRLLDMQRATIFTSATLAIGGDFSYPIRRLGIDQMKGGPATRRRYTTLDAESPFDYKHQARILVLPQMPNPSTEPEAHAEAFARSLEQIITTAGGRTLALFTSWRSLTIARDYLRTALPNERILAQEPGVATNQLAVEFAQDQHASLLGTRTFMTGISVPGDSLIAVALDRIPFPRKDDPLIAQRVEVAGRAGFQSVILAEALIALEQAFGRLIRTVDDRGLFIIGDPRLLPHRSRYAATAMNVLPVMPRGIDTNEALTFLKDVAAEADKHRPEPTARVGDCDPVEDQPDLEPW